MTIKEHNKKVDILS